MEERYGRMKNSKKDKRERVKEEEWKDERPKHDGRYWMKIRPGKGEK